MLEHGRNSTFRSAHDFVWFDAPTAPQNERDPAQKIAVGQRRIRARYSIAARQDLGAGGSVPYADDPMGDKLVVANEQNNIPLRNVIPANPPNYEGVARP